MVVVRQSGAVRDNLLLFIGHLAVFEARPSDGCVDPFQLTEKDEDAAVLEGLIRLKRESHVPDRDIYAAFAADEESGVDDRDAVR
jgi:acetylornithine deacetylase/succinyl-diaminopimelate desuccinylase-like protein